MRSNRKESPDWLELSAIGLGAGLDRVGVASCEPFEDARAALEDRKRHGLDGGLTFTYNDPARSTDVRRSIPWAQALVVGGLSYLPEAGSPGPLDGQTGRIGRFAVEDHYAPLRHALGEIAGALGAAGFQTEILVDDNRLVDRAAAVRAGIGWWGKNTMVLAPGTGPWMLLGTVVTDADLDPTPAMVRDCGTCDACMPACPTGALVAPGVLDARLCLAAILQQRGAIPVELRPLVGDRVYGCDDCLEACPPGARLLESAPSTRGRVDIRWLLDASDEDLLSSFARFYLPRRRPDTLRRNALVAAGNSNNPELLAPVERHLDSPDPVLAEHARWAAGRLRDSTLRASPPPA